MAYKVVFAPTAIARLEDIVRYIAADDLATASTFAMHLLDRAELLSEFPELGTPTVSARMSGVCGAIPILSTIACTAKTV